jgi:hypothetical protein
MVVWADETRQCTLWIVHGLPELRIYDGSQLIYSEPVKSGAGLEQARALRGLYRTASSPRDAGDDGEAGTRQHSG